MKRTAILSAAFGALAAAFMTVPANALPASSAKLLTTETSGAVQTVGYRGGHGGYNRGHGGGVRFFLGGRRHGGYAYGGGHRRNYAWGGYGRRGHGGGYGYGGGHGRRH